MLIQHYYLISLPCSNFKFCQFSTNALFQGGENVFSPVQDLMLSYVSWVIWNNTLVIFLFCFVVTLTFLKCTGHLFCTMSLNLGLSDVFSWSYSSSRFFGRNIAEVLLGPPQCLLSGLHDHLFVPSLASGGAFQVSSL